MKCEELLASAATSVEPCGGSAATSGVMCNMHTDTLELSAVRGAAIATTVIAQHGNTHDALAN